MRATDALRVTRGRYPDMKSEPTTLASDGFVADEVEAVVDTIRTRYAAHLALIAQLNRLLTAAQYKLRVDSRSAQQLTCAALFIRALAHCQATMVLIERGIRPSARAVMRCALEALFNLGACASDHRLALAFVDSHLHDRKRLGRYLSQVSAPETKALIEADIAETLKAINADIESVGATERRTRAMAKAAGLEDIYLTGYSLLSGAVHSTVGDLEQHFRGSEGARPMELLTEPATEGLNEELELLAAVMSGVAEPVDKVFALGLSAPCERLNDSIQALSTAGGHPRETAGGQQLWQDPGTAAPQIPRSSLARHNTMSLDDLQPEELQALGAIRVRRREINDSVVAENRALLEIINAASVRRSEKRHKFMLLAGGIVGVAVPVMLQSPLATEFVLVRVGSGLLLLTIVVGAVFEAIDNKRTTPLVLLGATGIARSAALALAEDAKLVAAKLGVTDPRLDANEGQHRGAAEAADKAMSDAGEKFGDIGVLETVLFFGFFVLGVMCLVLAVGRANPTAG